MKITIEEKMLMLVIKNQDKALNLYHNRDREKNIALYWKAAEAAYQNYLSHKKKPFYKKWFFGITRFFKTVTIAPFKRNKI